MPTGGDSKGPSKGKVALYVLITLVTASAVAAVFLVWRKRRREQRLAKYGELEGGRTSNSAHSNESYAYAAGDGSSHA